MITGGFGTMFDLETGARRQWVIGRDGVKRWSDTNEPVTPSDTKKDWADEYLTMITDCEKREPKMTEWERKFIADIKLRLQRRQLATPNQLEKLNDIWERVTRNG